MTVVRAKHVLKGSGEGMLPPMLEQYVALRDEYPEYMLLFQVGDFYETFGEDAERCARLLGISLTHKTSKDFSTPMAGIPIRAGVAHIEKLVNMGHKVAIADQIEEAGSGLVQRKVTQLLTPGTLTEERLLTADENYLCAIATGDGYAMSLLDVSTGEFKCASFSSKTALYDEIAKHRPKEVLLAPEIALNPALLSEFQSRFSLMHSQSTFELADCEAAITAQFQTIPEFLNTLALRRVVGAALSYAKHAQQGELNMVRRIQRFDPSAHMHLPETTLSALEVFKANSPTGRTLQECLLETRTSGGRRRLRSWLRQPLMDEHSIGKRQDAIEDLVRNAVTRNTLRSLLYRAHDLERLSARVSSGLASPREVVSLARTLELLPELSDILQDCSGTLSDICQNLSAIPEVVELIRGALVNDPPIKLGEGGLIQDGYHSELDSLRQKALDGRTWMANLETLERERTSIGNLKVGYNQIFGYYLEVTSSHLHKVPSDYQQVATLKDRARFVRPDVRETENQIARAEQSATLLEIQIFNDIRQNLKHHAEKLIYIAHSLSEVDVLCALAEIAATRGWVRPKSAGHVKLTQARHAVVEQAIGESFIPNNVQMHALRHMLVITGPNMAGKSTYLRMVALCALLHQMGSFVPAEHAELPIFDAIHTRIGASDDLAGGRSTFMVEMSELASILHTATPNSLIILDEVGRGTSTYDGLAIAWSSLEYLQKLQAFTLYATHYFELTKLSSKLSGVVNLHVAAEEDSGGLTFYHQVLDGAASDSYGVKVAKMAGLPSSVIERSDVLLGSFKAKDNESQRQVLDHILSLDLATLSPLQALAELQKLQEQLQ